MRKATTFLFVLFFFASAGTTLAQETEYMLNVPLSDDFESAYTSGEVVNGGLVGTHSGARGVNGPFNLDGDDQEEVLVTDYSGGGRVHVVENRGADQWELVYSTPHQDSTSEVDNARYAAGADLDQDGDGEILFISGQGFVDSLGVEMQIYESQGDDDYGDEPAATLKFETADGRPQPGIISEKFTAGDFNDDGQQDILVPANSGSAFDVFYIYSFTGDEISGAFPSFDQKLALNPRSSSAAFGGGSPYAMHPADLNGDGNMEVSMHSWNAFNFFNLTGDYSPPDSSNPGPNTNLNASSGDGDYVSLFAGVVTDINQDGDDEVFYPNLFTGDAAVLNYEDGEDPASITSDQLVRGVVPGLSALGIAAGDLDQDGQMELFGSGASYTAESRAADQTPSFISYTEFTGGEDGDPEDPANYSSVQFTDSFADFDTSRTNFDLIVRDSAGARVDSFLRTTDADFRPAGTYSGQGPLFVSKMAYLGDPDEDGSNELAAAFQGVDDTTYVIRQEWNEEDSAYVTTDILERRPVENRVFMRVLSSDGFSVDVVDERVVMPTDYKLSKNYPNPFRGETHFEYELPLEKAISIRVYNVQGRLVKTLVDDERRNAGKHRITWDGTNAAGQPVASGVYFYALEYGNYRATRRMVRVK
jgi:hypothetical protein